MIRSQFSLDLNDELIVDSFAGGGGASCGIEMALGRHVDIAIDHNAKAIAMHTANHPQTEHFPKSVWDVDPIKVTRGRRVGLAWFSPDCKHFSKAKGGKPKDKKTRGLAWIVIWWVATVRPRVLMLENVEEFMDWGPLLEDGHPDPAHIGRTFQSFRDVLTTGVKSDNPDIPEILSCCGKQVTKAMLVRGFGYNLDVKERRACNAGAPTIRKRLYIIARCDGRAIVWPEPTHGDPESDEVKKGKLKPWRTAAECIDWSIPCPSIFTRKKPLVFATLRRIAKGMFRYVIDAAEPFIVPLTHQGSERRNGLEKPMPTVTGANRGELALVTPMITEHANASHQRTMPANVPLRTQCAEVKGGHFALVVAFLAEHYGGVVGIPVTEPTGTVTAKDHHALVAAHLVRQFGTSNGADVDAPMGTIVANGGGAKTSLVKAFLQKYYGKDKDGIDLAAPMHTVVTKDRFGLVTVKQTLWMIVDIGMRMLWPRELFRAQGFPDSYIIGDKPEQGLKLSKTDQVRMVGNSVCPPEACALVAANVPELAVWGKGEIKRRRIAA